MTDNIRVNDAESPSSSASHAAARHTSTCILWYGLADSSAAVSASLIAHMRGVIGGWSDDSGAECGRTQATSGEPIMVLVEVTDRNVPGVLGKVVSRHNLWVGLGNHGNRCGVPP